MNIVMLLGVILLGGVTSSPENDICDNNKACELAFQLKEENKTCWVCQDRSAQARIFPYQPTLDSVCAVTRLCTNHDCVSDVGVDHVFKFIASSSLNIMLTLMDSIWVTETGNNIYRRLEWTNKNGPSVKQNIPSIWPTQTSTNTKPPRVSKAYTVCNDEGQALKLSGEDVETIQVINKTGVICLSVTVKPGDNSVRHKLGHSKCAYTLKATYDVGQTSPSLWMGGSYFPQVWFSDAVSVKFNFPMPMGMYWVCGNRAYSRWPYNATGTCYIAAVTLAVWTVEKEHFHDLGYQYEPQTHRQRREITYTASGRKKWKGYQMRDPWTGTGDGIGWTLTLWGGVSVAFQKINGLAYHMQVLANSTAASLALLNEEMRAIRSELLAHRLALDLLLAEQGGLCQVVNTSCCFLVPDYYNNISDYIQDIKDAVPNPPPPSTIDAIFEDFANMFGTTAANIFLTFLRLGLPIIVPVVAVMVLISGGKLVVNGVFHILAKRTVVKNYVTFGNQTNMNVEVDTTDFPFYDTEV